MALECDDWPVAENIHVISSASQADAEQWLEGLEADGPSRLALRQACRRAGSGEGFQVYTVCWD